MYLIIVYFSATNINSDVLHDQFVQLMQINVVSNVGVATTFLIITGCYLYLGYTIWEQSG